MNTLFEQLEYYQDTYNIHVEVKLTIMAADKISYDFNIYQTDKITNKIIDLDEDVHDYCKVSRATVQDALTEAILIIEEFITNKLIFKL